MPRHIVSQRSCTNELEIFNGPTTLARRKQIFFLDVFKNADNSFSLTRKWRVRNGHKQVYGCSIAQVRHGLTSCTTNRRNRGY